MCGEKLTNDRLSLAVKGSPPRVRGKRAVIAATDAIPGITPRVRGKALDPVQLDAEAGITPRVRGKAPTADLDRQCVGRITPACAGKSLLACRVFPFHGDHPRVCGEKHGLSDTYTSYSGSPRVWGKRLKKALKNKDF